MAIGEHSSTAGVFASRMEKHHRSSPEIKGRLGYLKPLHIFVDRCPCKESIQKQTCGVVRKGQKRWSDRVRVLKLHGLEEEKTLLGKARLGGGSKEMTHVRNVSLNIGHHNKSCSGGLYSETRRPRGGDGGCDIHSSFLLLFLRILVLFPVYTPSSIFSERLETHFLSGVVASRSSNSPVNRFSSTRRLRERIRRVTNIGEYWFARSGRIEARRAQIASFPEHVFRQEYRLRPLHYTDRTNTV